MALQTATTLYIVRHGETVWNTYGLLQGHGNSPLTDTGIKQAENIATTLQDIHIDAIFSSDLERAQKTADIIAQKHHLPVQTSQLLRERHFGVYEGKPFKEYTEAHHKLFIEHPQLDEDEKHLLAVDASVETIKHSTDRLVRFIQSVSDIYPGKTIVLVTHGGIMRYFLIHIKYGTHKSLPPGSISNTAYVKLQTSENEIMVRETRGIHLCVSLP